MAETKGAVIAAAELAATCAAIAEERKAGDVVMIPVGEHSIIAEYLVLCTAGSEPHLRALENHLGRELLKRHRLRPRTVDGTAASQWIVMDFAGVMVHLMTQETRDLYQLENLWRNAPTLAEIENLSERLEAHSGTAAKRRK